MNRYERSKKKSKPKKTKERKPLLKDLQVDMRRALFNVIVTYFFCCVRLVPLSINIVHFNNKKTKRCDGHQWIKAYLVDFTYANEDRRIERRWKRKKKKQWIREKCWFSKICVGIIRYHWHLSSSKSSNFHGIERKLRLRNKIKILFHLQCFR